MYQKKKKEEKRYYESETESVCFLASVSQCACVCTAEIENVKSKTVLDTYKAYKYIFKMSNEKDKWAIMSVKLVSLTDVCVSKRADFCIRPFSHIDFNELAFGSDDEWPFQLITVRTETV